METDDLNKPCGEKAGGCCESAQPLEILPMAPRGESPEKNGGSCCGTTCDDVPQDVAEDDPADYITSFITSQKSTPVGEIPRVTPELDFKDRLATVKVRAGIGRDNYKIAPGLYCIGDPDAESPVLVTANYKLSFDHLRRELGQVDAWIIVLNTVGINVWCAAGKGTFASQELVKRIEETQIAALVNEKRLILPQLGATGVSAVEVKRRTGFKVVWGPIRANDLPAFLSNGARADDRMRQVTFTLAERAVLVPVELSLVLKPALMAIAVMLLLSGIGPQWYSVPAALQRGPIATLGIVAGIVGGAVLAPILLPWIYGTAFAVKGTVTGLVCTLPVAATLGVRTGMLGVVALLLFSIAVSSYLAMNFTGATPFTSPTGVEREMRKAIPFQLGAAVLGLLLWIGSGF